MNTANHQFPKPLPQYRAEDAVNRRKRKLTFEEEMIDNMVKSTLAAWDLIDPEVIERACRKYLAPRGYNVIIKAT